MKGILSKIRSKAFNRKYLGMDKILYAGTITGGKKLCEEDRLSQHASNRKMMPLEASLAASSLFNITYPIVIFCSS
jgi:hypothetical protein